MYCNSAEAILLLKLASKVKCFYQAEQVHLLSRELFKHHKLLNKLQNGIESWGIGLSTSLPNDSANNLLINGCSGRNSHHSSNLAEKHLRGCRLWNTGRASERKHVRLRAPHSLIPCAHQIATLKPEFTTDGSSPGVTFAKHERTRSTAHAALYENLIEEDIIKECGKRLNRDGKFEAMIINNYILSGAIRKLSKEDSLIDGQTRIIEHWWDGIDRWKA